MTLERIARLFGWLGSTAILGLSLVPGPLRPHVMASGHAEHFAAYLATALCFSYGAQSRAGRLAALAALSLLSGAVEIAQMWIPGRSGEFSGFLFSSAGALAGTIAGLAALRLVARPAKG